MAIQEKPTVLEFNWTENGDDLNSEKQAESYDIVYDPQRESNPLTICNKISGQMIQCSVDMIKEIVFYLTKKGIIEIQNSVSNVGVGPFARSLLENQKLPMPQIQKKGKINDQQIVIPEESSRTIPIASFDVPTSKAVLNQNPTIENSQIKTASGITVDKNTESEIPKRPVIRTQSDDGAEAEQIAARTRSGLEKSNVKKIKSHHMPIEE